MPFNLNIPLTNGDSKSLDVNTGNILFVLGANGTGKSSLMHRFYVLHNGNARRISAHRQNWLSSNTLDLSPLQKRNIESSIRSTDYHETARWKEDYSEQRTYIAIYDLINAENVRAREVTHAFESGNNELGYKLIQEDGPVRQINDMLALSNIPIEIAIRENEQIVATKSGGPEYSISELSDGERNALLVAANVLTAPEGTLILIDEPERHLHRSIISPLLTHLFDKRPDCVFVISTHEVMLPLDNPDAQVLLVRGCVFASQSDVRWDADLISPDTELDDNLRRDILGARRTVLFVEGDEQSLDKRLYGILFPDTSIIPKSNCREVEHAVASLRDANELHWIHPFGIVDNDRRPSNDIERLKEKGVYAVSVYSVESLYYHPSIQQLVTERHSASTGEDAAANLNNAEASAIEAIKPHAQRLCKRVAEKAIREEFFAHIPQVGETPDSPIEIAIDVGQIIADEESRFDKAVNAGNLEEIIGRYSIRETPALDRIASKLGFQNRKQYENAVLNLVRNDDNALELMRRLFGTLVEDMTNNASTPSIST